MQRNKIPLTLSSKVTLEQNLQNCHQKNIASRVKALKTKRKNSQSKKIISKQIIHLHKMHQQPDFNHKQNLLKLKLRHQKSIHS